MSEPSPFPDIRWGPDTGWLHEAMIKFGGTKAGSAFIRSAAPFDRWLLTKSKGRFTALGPIGAQTVLLVSTGAKSGARRVQPLLYYREDPHIYLIGSNFGGEKHPAWTYNLLAGGPAAVIIGREIPVTATLLEGAERERILQGFIEMVKVYQVYLTRTDRELRIFRLTAV